MNIEPLVFTNQKGVFFSCEIKNNCIILCHHDEATGGRLSEVTLDEEQSHDLAEMIQEHIKTD